MGQPPGVVPASWPSLRVPTPGAARWGSCETPGTVSPQPGLPLPRAGSTPSPDWLSPDHIWAQAGLVWEILFCPRAEHVPRPHLRDGRTVQEAEG